MTPAEYIAASLRHLTDEIEADPTPPHGIPRPQCGYHWPDGQRCANTVHKDWGVCAHHVIFGHRDRCQFQGDGKNRCTNDATDNTDYCERHQR